MRGPRRELAVVVLACAVAAALVLYVASRTWAVEVVPRPAPLPDRQQEHSGGALAPYLPALGWVALAGAGAVLATRGRGRWAVGSLLAAAGAGVLVGSLWQVPRPEVGAGWPVVCALAGLVVAGAGAWTVWRGGRWPSMGARYERRRGRGAEPAAEAAGEGGSERLWEALDRGEDPTD